MNSVQGTNLWFICTGDHTCNEFWVTEIENSESETTFSCVAICIVFIDFFLATCLEQRVWTTFCKICSGTPHLTIFGEPRYAYLAKYGQFRCIVLRSIGPYSQKLWPNPNFGQFPHCNYNIKLQMGGHETFMRLYIWKNHEASICPKEHVCSRLRSKSKKKIWFSLVYMKS